MASFVRTVLLSVCLVAGACTSSSSEAPTTTTGVPEESASASSADATPVTGEATDSTDSTITGGPTVTGEALPIASARHKEGDPTVGLMAPSLTFGEVRVPSGKPTLLLVAVGSCADCESAALSLLPLTDEFDTVPIVIGPQDTGDMPEPWIVLNDPEIARAFGGRDRPTALVIGLDGKLLSLVRPFNRSGTEYDMEDLRFALQIATNQTSGKAAAGPVAVLDDARPGPLPDSFVGVQTGGDVVQVDSLSGGVLNRIPSIGDLSSTDGSQVFVEAVSIPGTDSLLLNECCEPAAGSIVLLDGWAGYDHEESHLNALFAWEMSPSPDGARLAFSGFARSIRELGAGTFGSPGGLGGSNGSNPDVAWLRDRLGVVYLHRGNSPAVAEVIEFDSEYRPISRNSFSLWGPASAIDVNADGNLVVVSSPAGSGASIGQVYHPETGELLAEFALEDGVVDIDYDITGRFLAYVDADGIARWQGGGDSGVLGEGFFNVSW